MFSVQAEKLSTPRPTRKLEDHKLSTIHVCCFNESAANLQIWISFSSSLHWGHPPPSSPLHILLFLNTHKAKKSFWEMKEVPGILALSTSCIRVVSFMPLPHFAIGQDARWALRRREISLLHGGIQKTITCSSSPYASRYRRSYARSTGLDMSQVNRPTVM
jgi:hypothetical protein